MKFSLLPLTLGVVIACAAAGPAFAAKGCSTAPASQWKSKAELKSQLSAEGLKVRQIKSERGCYEVYATNKSGKRQNMAYNAQTLEKLANAEAGEK